MRHLRAIGWAVLCLGPAGCAGTRHCVFHGPGGHPRLKTLLAAHTHPRKHCWLHRHTHTDPSCVCGPAPTTTPTSQATATQGAVEGSQVAGRFFPRFIDKGKVPVGPPGKARPDPLGVRTTRRTVERPRDEETSGRRDSEMVRTTGDEELPPLPVTMSIAVPSGNAAATAPDTTAQQPGPPPAPPDDPTEAMLPAAAEDAAPSPPRSDPSIPLEQVDDPGLAGRPRLQQDGTVAPRPSQGDPTRYGPEPTYPAAYYDNPAAPTSVPKTREVWPTRQPWRPTLLSRIARRFRKVEDPPEDSRPPSASTSKPASAPASARGEPRDVAQQGRGVERIAGDRLDEASQR